RLKTSVRKLRDGCVRIALQTSRLLLPRDVLVSGHALVRTARPPSASRVAGRGTDGIDKGDGLGRAQMRAASSSRRNLSITLVLKLRRDTGVGIVARERTVTPARGRSLSMQ